MHNYLLEIGCEEIPARFVSGLLDELKSQVGKQLTDHGFAGFEIVAMGTYRRLALRISSLPDKPNVVQGPVWGPGLEFGENAARGFAKKQKVDFEDLKIKESNGRQFYVAESKTDNTPIGELLTQFIPQAVTQINCPIAMRWGDATHSFIRPVHWIVSLLDDQVVPFELFDIVAGNESRGHRMLTFHPKLAHLISGVPIVVTHESDYEVSLENHEVVVSPLLRRDRIISALRAHIPESEIDQPLVDEVVYLTENPVLLTGQFDAKYLDIPSEVLVEVMRKHQKYFPVRESGRLTNRFLVVADNVQENNATQIIAGNESVLRARLEDAAYFYQEDLKQPLIERADDLKRVVFQKNMGSVYDKAMRNGELMAVVADMRGNRLSESPLEAVQKGQHIALLGKCDLVTQLVSELPALQGLIGTQLYRFSEADEQAGFNRKDDESAIRNAIFEHYFPRFSGDVFPESWGNENSYGLLLAIADKLDTLVCCHVNNLLATGSQDPWGIRRNANGLIALATHFDWNFRFNDLIDRAYTLLNKGDHNKDKLKTLIATRLRAYLIEHKNVMTDIHDAVGSDRLMADMKGALAEIRALQQFRDSAPALFDPIVETGVRIRRLLKKSESSSSSRVDSDLFQVDLEREIWHHVQQLPRLFAWEIAPVYWSEVAKTTSQFAEYFESIMVMDPDLRVRQNRVAFLSYVLTDVLRGVDFEKMQRSHIM